MSTETLLSKSILDFKQHLIGVVQQALIEAKKQGASGAEVSAGMGSGLSVTVRLAEIETIEHNHDKNLQITVYFDHKLGAASTSDLSEPAIVAAVTAACTIARHTAADSCFGLADPERLIQDIPDLDLYHPYPLVVENSIELAQNCEEAGRSYDKRITNSEGATASSQEGIDVYGNTNGFIAALPRTRFSRSCSVIAQKNKGMQRDYWYDAKRNFIELEVAEQVGKKAAQRAIRRLDARKLPTCKAPVIYEAPVASSLLSHFISAITGGNLYRQASFLVDHLGKKIFPEMVNVSERPYILQGMGSTAYDQEGVATQNRDIVSDGILEGYVLNSYSARKLGMVTTGNAGGIHNLEISHGDSNLQELVKKMGRGLLITELIGFGVNMVTGDYSRGVTGFWVENGEIQYPVEEITVAGNLEEMYQQFLEIGNDVDVRRNIRTGSIMLENMTIGGN